jgi:OOP family OmpA-OmpF porin
MKSLSLSLFAGLAFTLLFPARTLRSEDVTGRTGLGGSLGISDFLNPDSIRRQTNTGSAASGWIRHGLTSRGELQVAFDNIQAKGKESRSLSRLRPLTLNWLQSFGEGKWTPYLSGGAGPVWVRRVENFYENRMMMSLRGGAGIERRVFEDIGIGTGLTYHYVFSDGRYAPSSAALSLQVSANWFFPCGAPGPKPQEKAAPPPPPPSDADGDGIPDSRDSCPGTAAGVAVDALGCPKDSDGDGVVDNQDDCPNTPPGTLINDAGCPAKKVSVTLDLKFATGKATLGKEFDPQLTKCADFMKRFPSTTVLIEGHSDSSGSAAKNKALSQRRADAVRSALVERFDIPAERVTAKGFGIESPIADNATAEGRAANRRVVATLSAFEK